MKRFLHLAGAMLIMAMIIHPSAKGQDKSPCIANMLKYIDRMAGGNPKPEKGRAFFMHYVSENVPHEKFRSTVIKNEFKVYITPTQTILESDDIAVYRDQVDLFAVVHPLKKVIWNPAGPDPEATTASLREMADLQKQILTTGKIVQCTTIGSGENRFQKAELIPAEMYRNEHHITSLVIMFDLQEEMVEKVVVNFKADQDVITQIITYKEVNFDYQDFKPVTIKKQFLDKNGNLNDKYLGYTLVKN